MNLCKEDKGFTLIELVMVIVILGILAAVAVPKFQDISTKAKEAATLGVVGGVRAGIGAVYAYNLVENITPAYPATLDNAAASSSARVGNEFFDNVLDQGGITKDWTKGSDAAYYYTDAVPSGSSYQYNSTDGTFLRKAGR